MNEEELKSQSIFDGFVDEILEYKSINITNYYRGRLIAKFILKCEEYTDAED